MGHKGSSRKKALLDFSLSAIFSLYYDAKVMLTEKKKKKKTGFLITSLKSVSQKSYFTVSKLWSPSLL